MENKALRLRFAPSPTGSLHVGGARTALFNYLLARRTGGTFILRIEDTDANRNRPESEAAVIEDLHWLGLHWDEGPDVGGPYGPYRQSERMDGYAKSAQELLDKDAAYPCYCTTEELERDHADQKAAGIVATRYGGRCARLTPEQREVFVAEGRQPALRLRIPGGQTVIEDLVHGKVIFDHAQLGDLVLVRANTMPTYNFVAALDDAAMAIDIVVRGDEHLANTPYQMLVLAALDRKAPAYAHVPLILNEDHQKLSKRHQTVGVASYREQGYLAEALLDHLVLLGWSPGDDSEHWTLEDLAKIFSLDRVGRSPSVYNGARLKAFNARAIRALPREELSALFAERLRAADLGEYADNAEWLHHFCQAFGEEVEVLADVPLRAHAIMDMPAELDEAGKELAARADSRVFLSALLAAVENDGAMISVPPNKAIPALAKAQGFPTKDAYVLVRLALTGTSHGPPLGELIGMLGAARVRERLAAL
jgi:nondiscriminating glutamyl-tRNA synthetase